MEIKLQKIEDKVRKLEDYVNNNKESVSEKEVIEKLQEINKCFLQNIIIKINRLKIYPVEIEIYYYKEGTFKDSTCHRNELQENNFSNLYFHRAGRLKEKKTLIDTTYHGGVDVCLSKGKYNLSILLRSAYIINRKETKLITGIHRVVNQITDELESLLEEGKINIEYDIYEDKKDEKKDFLGKRIDDFCSHERIKKTKKKEIYFGDKRELNTFINNTEIIEEIYKDKDEEIKNNLRKKLNNDSLFK